MATTDEGPQQQPITT